MSVPRELLERTAETNGKVDFDPFKLIKDGMRALSERVYTWVILLMAFALFGFAAWQREAWSFAAACAFTCLVYIPHAWRER